MIELEKGIIKNLNDNSVQNYSLNFLSDYPERLKISSIVDRDWHLFNMGIMEKHIIPFLIDGDDEGNLKLFRKYNIEDYCWSWFNKAMQLQVMNYLWFSASIGSSTQCMAVIFHPKESRLTQREIFYIDFLATAPWNRDSPANQKEYSGFGTKLLKVACQYCITEFKYCPGFSLHSLPNSEDYYRKIGMIDFGIDEEKERLRYFEMKEDDCREFFLPRG
ncbi:GNAT family N-acetyltransferase [Leptospira selangorensis]|uniref:GNAT family N-acetyltransferase n=1 Tax=Leptospira selangorensis TaxID=2484982 RepID=A0A5F2C6C1_9LEPT|nr:GNAT family N-acetyltransferase [Leptospira selangorensis]TGM10267.1 GNAT family N-acetyltransferase [Leptospira selangorensis]TGM27928.1 GNAT family N-acetyltransferase [Leptospira selangorensis]